MTEPESIASTLDVKTEKLKKRVKRGKNGGARPGAGMPKGYVTSKKLEAIRVRNAFNQRIMQNANRLFNAQMNLAVGEQALYVIITEGTGKNKKRHHELVTDHKIIEQYLDWEQGIGTNENPSDDEHYYYLSTKPANNMAIDSLLNRALGKVPDKLIVEGGFFSENKLTIEVIGERQQPSGADGVIDGEVAGATEAPVEQASGPSASTTE